MTFSHEGFYAPPVVGEQSEKSPSKAEKFLSKIKGFKEKIAQKLGLKGEELTEATDEALVYAAKETISEADKDGTRTDEEAADIMEAVSSVVVQGAMEKAGYDQSSGDNPIIALDQAETEADLIDSIASLHHEDVTLPTGEDVAELAARVIDEYENPSATPERERTPRPELSQVVREIQEARAENSGEVKLYPRVEFRCDHDHIEGQKISIYDKEPAGCIIFKFKVRFDLTDVYKKLENRAGTDRHADICFSYKKGDKFGSSKLCDGLSFEREGVRVVVARPDTGVMTARGLVKIEAPKDMPPEEVERIVKDVLEQDLEIPDGLSEVPEDSEKQYKESRFAWSHKVEGGKLEYESLREEARRMELAEVAPGYTTYVEPGKHKEYEKKYGEMRAYHRVFSRDTGTIVSLLTNGLICTSERYERGLMADGMSSDRDLTTGGGDSVFTRVGRPEEIRQEATETVIVFKPEVFDRSDWYAYDSDTYGSTDPYYFSHRKSPDVLFSKLKDGNLGGGNEQMFRHGIGPEYIESILVDPDQRDEILNTLRERGVTEIGGRPIEEVVVANEKFYKTLPMDTSFDDDDWTIVDDWNTSPEDKKLAKLAKYDAIKEGKETFGNAQELLDLCDNVDQLMELMNAIVANGHADKLTKVLADMIYQDVSLDTLGQYLHHHLEGEEGQILNPVFDFMKKTLKVNLKQIYKLKKKEYK